MNPRRFSRAAAGAFAMLIVALFCLAASDPASAGWKTREETLTDTLRAAGVGLSERELVLAAKSHRDEEVRLAAISMIGLRKFSAASEELKQIVAEDQEPFVRRQAARALAELGDAAGVAGLKGLLNAERDVKARLALAVDLAVAGDGAGFGEVERAVSDPDVAARELAVRMLPYFAGLKDGIAQRSVSLLVAATDDQEPSVRGTALLGFSDAASRGASLDLLRKRAEDLSVTDGDAEVRRGAALTVGSLRYILECRERPMRVGCPEGSKKFLEDCRKDPKREECDGLFPPK